MALASLFGRKKLFLTYQELFQKLFLTLLMVTSDSKTDGNYWLLMIEVDSDQLMLMVLLWFNGSFVVYDG